MASVNGIYARAFADVVMKTGSRLDPAGALQELRSIEALLKESDPLRRVLENPSIPGDRKRAVLDAIAKRLRTTRQVRNFIAVVTDHRRLPLFSEILKQLEQELNDRQGFAEAQVSTARPLSDHEKQMLEAEITKIDRQKSSSALRTRHFATGWRSRASRQHDLRRFSKRPVGENSGAVGGDLAISAWPFALGFNPKGSTMRRRKTRDAN